MIHDRVIVLEGMELEDGEIQFNESYYDIYYNKILLANDEGKIITPRKISKSKDDFNRVSTSIMRELGLECTGDFITVIQS